MNIVEFPLIGLKLTLREIAIPLPIGTGGIRWYAIFIVTGLILALIVGTRELKRLGEDTDHLYNIILWGLPLSIVGARLYYVLFSLPYYIENPGEIVKTWHGGIAIYGALIAAFITAWVYCRKHRLPVLRYFDVGAYGFLIGQIIGRYGNFVNGEAFGAETDVPWRMVLNGVGVHPAFLYESLWNLGVFLFIWLRRKKYGFEGRAISLYMILYGIGRFWIEGLRTDSLYIGNLRISQLISVLLVLSGTILYFRFKKNWDGCDRP